MSTSDLPVGTRIIFRLGGKDRVGVIVKRAKDHYVVQSGPYEHWWVPFHAIRPNLGPNLGPSRIATQMSH